MEKRQQFIKFCISAAVTALAFVLLSGVLGSELIYPM